MKDERFAHGITPSTDWQDRRALETVSLGEECGHPRVLNKYRYCAAAHMRVYSTKFQLDVQLPATGQEEISMTEHSVAGSRPTWDEYFMHITEVVSSRSTCMRRQVGAVIVLDKQILATGYNGAARGMAHCTDVGCLRAELNIPSGQRHELCRGLHAEQNAIIQAAQHGISIKGGSLYTTHQPCFICAKMIINAGLKRVIYAGGYPDELALKAFGEARLELVAFPKDGSQENWRGFSSRTT